MNNKLLLLAIEVTFLLISLISLARTDCLLPKKKLPNGRILFQPKFDSNLTSVPENYRLRFKCKYGYTLIGSGTIFCFADEWTDTIPTCLRMTCGIPPTIENGSYKVNSGTTNSFTLGTTVEYSCNDGFEMANSTTSILTCSLFSEKNSVLWVGNVPNCTQKESCPDPGVSKDGKRIVTSFYVGNIIEYFCNDEFELVGDDKIECLQGGRWSSPRPLCRPSSDYCELPPDIPHGVPKGDKEGDYYRPYDEIEIVCEPGYSYKGGSQFVLCEEDGQWEEEFGECTEVYCDRPPPLENGKISEIEEMNVTKLPYNFEVTYICEKGYRLIGDSWRFCDARGWSGNTPHCEVVKCPDPGVPEHGTRLLEGQNIRDKVIFKCFTGYTLIGSFERYCMPNGQWSGELARCDHENNYCPDPGIPINGMKNSSNYEMGERISFTCQSGYTLLGAEVRECLPHRIWSGNEVKCLGPYDFDNSARVRDILMAAIAEKEQEQKRKTLEYQQAKYSARHNGTLRLARVLDLNFPGRLILYFAFDVSGSVGQHNFQKSIDFAKAIVKRIGITDIGARAGALTFSSKANTQFLPLDYKTTDKVVDALDRIDYTGGGTSASSALALIREELIPLTQAVLTKRGQKSIIFILTDGKANMGGDPQQEAEKLKAAGVEIYCIGITSAIMQDSLYKIASENDAGSKEEYVFILKDYATMDWLVQRITNGTIDYSQCGIGLEDLGTQTGRGRILGGRKAPDPWPWMAALYFREQGFKAELKCGGSVIHEKFILTASHCLFVKKNKERRKDKDIIVKLGLTNVKNETNIQEYEILKSIIHPQYRYGLTFDYDIALLQLKRPIEFNAFIRPICLPPSELYPNSTLYKTGQYTIATGFGHEGTINKMGEVQTKSVENLKEIILPIQSRERCLQSAAENLDVNIPVDEIFTDRMFCVGDGNGGNDTCEGDSGGPLMQSQQDFEGNIYWTQIGIVSWGIGCGLPNTYGYYTHIQNLFTWIANITLSS